MNHNTGYPAENGYAVAAPVTGIMRQRPTDYEKGERLDQPNRVSAEGTDKKIALSQRLKQYV